MMAMEMIGRSSLREKQVGSGFGASVLRSQQFSLPLFLRAHLECSLLALQQQRLFIAVAFLLHLLLQPRGQSSPAFCCVRSTGDWAQQEALAMLMAATPSWQRSRGCFNLGSKIKCHSGHGRSRREGRLHSEQTVKLN